MNLEEKEDMSCFILNGMGVPGIFKFRIGSRMGEAQSHGSGRGSDCDRNPSMELSTLRKHSKKSFSAFPYGSGMLYRKA